MDFTRRKRKRVYNSDTISPISKKFVSYKDCLRTVNPTSVVTKSCEYGWKRKREK